MAGIQLRDEAVRDRVRAAQEFLDPSASGSAIDRKTEANSREQMTHERAVTARMSCSCSTAVYAASLSA